MGDEVQLGTALAGLYEVEREIGAGGMATVYLARDVKHSRKVALKVLRSDLGAVLGVERFLSEIRVTANLQHPNLLLYRGAERRPWFSTVAGRGGRSENGRSVKSAFVPPMRSVRDSRG